MAKKCLRYILSVEADQDLEAIFDYTEKEFGFNQAVKYLTALEIVFNHLVNNPTLGRKRDGIKKGLFSISEQEHIVFYRLLTTKISIVRVLHGSRDLPNYF